jgi:chloramphenicol O-acetyltransferase
MTTEMIKEIVLDNNKVFEYLEAAHLISIREFKNGKEIVFKDENGDLSIFINNVPYASYTLLATVDGKSYNACLSAEEFNKFWNKYKIFKI